MRFNFGYNMPMLQLLFACQAPSKSVAPEGAEWTEADIWAAYDNILVQGLPNASQAFSTTTRRLSLLTALWSGEGLVGKAGLPHSDAPGVSLPLATSS